MKHIFTGFNLKGAIALLAKWRFTVKIFNQELERGATQMRRFCGIILAVALSIACIAAGLADPAPAAGVPTEAGIRALALQWFAQMQAGKIDRTHTPPPMPPN
jgi:hypothetical protein